MIKIIFAHLRNHLGFSKSESNGVLLLIPTILFSIWLLHGYKNYLKSATSHSINEQQLEQWKDEIASKLIIKDSIESIKTGPIKKKSFHFNPNSISEEAIISLGFSDKTAKNWKKFIDAKGVFRKKEDLKRIYGISEERLDELWQYIEIPPAKKSTKPVFGEKTPKPILRSDLNLASKEDLIKVRGIGEVLSKRIIKFRDKLGGFHDMQQLSEVYGLDQEVITRIEEAFNVESLPRKFSINTDSIKQIAAHPYLNYNHARAIVNYRKQHGVYKELSDLHKIDILEDSVLIKIEPYLEFD